MSRLFNKWFGWEYALVSYGHKLYKCRVYRDADEPYFRLMGYQFLSEHRHVILYNKGGSDANTNVQEGK